MPPSVKAVNGHDASADDDETTPLLIPVAPMPMVEPLESAPDGLSSDQGHGALKDDEDAPLPYMQIFLLCFARVVEPIAFFSIFPYINKMIETVGGIEKKEVGYYSGVIESLFSLTQMCVMILWGKAADRFGRKPILVVSLFGISITTSLFGLSKSLWQMVLFRCLAGVFAGTIVTVRAMITENSTRKTQARAFSHFAFAGNLGIFAGPFIGGALESPASKFGAAFGHIRFFHDYPYALPSFVTGAIGLTAGLVSAFFIKETLHVHKGSKTTEDTKMSSWGLVKSPGVFQVILINTYVAVLAFAYTAVNPVFLYTEVRDGGVGFSPVLIAAAIGLAGASQALWLLFVFTPFHTRVGTGGVLRVCAVAWPFFFAAHPICSILRLHGWNVLFWILAPISVSVGSGVAMSFTACQLAINDIAPSHETFGTLNALVLAVSSGTRAFVPALSTSIFATGVKYRIFDGHLFWIVIIVLGAGLSLLLKLLPRKVDGPPRHEDDGGA
ncbi:MFS general substrate transporter [Corynespora cassiicola Philippines]|uniref:MFS general substrate transporter n=1 Tax=Corynespora cassiicola Philippines TaxID=1448308 RepID=A0A2T2P071_CORCC|nr:MFS general substrate transporter [Corynespora cassiicola Philippines]